MQFAKFLMIWSILIVAVRAEPPDLKGLERLRSNLPASAVGRVLLDELNCYRCHAPEGPSRGAPVLEGVRFRLTPAGIREAIANPKGFMPQVLGHLDESARRETVESLTHYLLSLDGPAPLAAEMGDPEQGKAFYHQVGCVACHGPEKGALPGLAEKFHPNGLRAFLEDPLAVRPSGRMPDMQLSHWEARDLTAYLIGSGATDADPVEIDETKVALGRSAFREQGCVQCHAPETPAKSAPALTEARVDQGCLGEASGTWPHYELADWQRAALRTAIEKPAGTTTKERIHQTLAQLNCIACHERDSLGGVLPEHDVHFTSANLNLGEQSRIPPALTGVGAKLTPKWLLKVLQQGASVRPYLHTRMPIFARDDVTPLAEWLAEEDARLAIEEPPELDDRAAREAGHQLVGVKGFGCISCHTYKDQSATTLEAVELTSMTSRLQKGWFQRYVRSPQSFQPLTIMPSYWPNGVSTRADILEGDPDKQVESLWLYLSHGRDARPPQGLNREPILLKVAEEAVMLRRNYPNVGKRGIGVGYPAGMHLVFDAGQMRLATIWTGEFVEASGAFRGQGSGHVQPRSREAYQLPVGPAIARLRKTGQRWPDSEAKKAEGFQFQGYDLDGKRRPMFRYRFGTVEFTDRFLDQSSQDTGSPSLERTLTVSKPSGTLYLRLAVADQINYRSGFYTVGDRLKLTLSRKGQIRRTHDNRPMLVVPLSEETLTVTYELP